MSLTTSIVKDFAKPDEFKVQDVTTWSDPSRASRKLVLFVERFTKDKYELVEAIPNGTPDAVTEWLVKLEKDGYYRILLISAPDHNSSQIFGIDQVVYGSTESHTGLFISVDENVPANTELSNPYYWVPVEAIEDYPMLTETGADCEIKDHVHDLLSRICIAEKAIKYASEPCDCPDETMTKDYFWSLMFHHAGVYSTAFGEFKEAGKFLDQVIDRCTNGSAPDKEDCGCHG